MGRVRISKNKTLGLQQELGVPRQGGETYRVQYHRKGPHQSTASLAPEDPGSILPLQPGGVRWLLPSHSARHFHLLSHDLGAGLLPSEEVGEDGLSRSMQPSLLPSAVISSTQNCRVKKGAPDCLRARFGVSPTCPQPSSPPLLYSLSMSWATPVTAAQEVKLACREMPNLA